MAFRIDSNIENKISKNNSVSLIDTKRRKYDIKTEKELHDKENRLMWSPLNLGAEFNW